jgi:hypothetical protein
VAEVADLFASLGLRVNTAQWAQGSAQIAKTSKELDGAFQDRGGRWRAASGRFLSMGEKAQLAAGGVKGLGDAADTAGGKAERAGRKAASSWDAAGAALKGYALYLGVHLGYEHLIKFNADMQTSIIGLSAMIEGNLGGSFANATAQAKDLYAEFQKFSTKTPVTTKEILEFGRSVAVATFQAGGKIKDLQEITEQGVIASKVLTPERGPGYASLELSEMLMGNVSNRMVFAKQLLGFVKMTEEQFRELDAKQRMAVVKRALNSPAMKDAAGAFQGSFAGVTSTLEDKLQITFGKIGLPLFEAITRAVVKFNKWLDENGDTIERVGKKIGDWLGDAFEVLSFAIGLVIEKGGDFLNWLDQFVDTGELVKSALYAIGAALVVFAAQSLIAFATNPIGLILLAVTALIYLFRKLLNYPGGIGKAFSDAWAAIKKGAQEVWDAIKDGFSAAFDFVADLPVIRNLVALVKALMGFLPGGPQANMLLDSTQMTKDALRAAHPELGAYQYHDAGSAADNEDRLLRGEQPIMSAPAGPSAAARMISIGTVAVGDINVHAPDADPVAVGEQVRKVFHEELGGVLRQTMDVIG